MASRLLILSCTERKVRRPRTLPAIDRYDGPSFRVVRRFAVEQPQKLPDVYVLSAKYGLIDTDTPVSWYDDRLTRSRCDNLRDEVARRIESLMAGNRYSNVFLFSGKDYLKLLLPSFEPYQKRRAVHVASGGLGEKLTRLKVWLAGESPADLDIHAVKDGKFVVRGREFRLSTSEMLHVARTAISNEDADAFRCHGWCVVIDGKRLAPKRLLAAATGLPVSAFHTDDARSVLSRLGFPLSQAFVL